MTISPAAARPTSCDNCHAEVVNGMDVLAVWDAVSRAAELCRQRPRPGAAGMSHLSLSGSLTERSAGEVPNPGRRAAVAGVRLHSQLRATDWRRAGVLTPEEVDARQEDAEARHGGGREVRRGQPGARSRRPSRRACLAIRLRRWIPPEWARPELGVADARLSPRQQGADHVPPRGVRGARGGDDARPAGGAASARTWPTTAARSR